MTSANQEQQTRARLDRLFSRAASEDYKASSVIKEEHITFSFFSVGVYFISYVVILYLQVSRETTYDFPPSLNSLIKSGNAEACRYYQCTQAPTGSPTLFPTLSPSLSPTSFPTNSPTPEPTLAPSMTPTDNPSNSPIIQPSFSPSMHPTLGPTDFTLSSP
eukprot:snap_masked-scaffold_1-processed-gene-13.22-mRNA-1 protein AED:0.29 eAED:0.29 QI:0/-1/0/1/-1/1/1/0/160